MEFRWEEEGFFTVNDTFFFFNFFFHYSPFPLVLSSILGIYSRVGVADHEQDRKGLGGECCWGRAINKIRIGHTGFERPG